MTTATTKRVYHLKFRPYVLNLRMPLRMARGVITQRKGIILKLAGGGRAAFSELVPLEHFGTESLESALVFLRDLSEITPGSFAAIPGDLPATRFAIEAALLEISREVGRDQYYREQMPFSRLLPADGGIFRALDDGQREGYTIFKMKIALGDFKDEFEVVERVASKLPGNAKIRIDANEGLSIEQARRWLGSLEDFPVEFLEQPLKRHQVEETVRLSEEFSTEVALDESIATSQDMIDCYGLGFRGVFASKPLRLAELHKFLEWRERTDVKISYSTVLETAIGSAFGIKLAASDLRNSYGLGYGVSHWFEETDLVLPSQPRVALEEILSLDREKIWERLA